MPRSSRKILLPVFFLVSSLAFTLFRPQSALAQTWWSQTPDEFGRRVNQGNPAEIFGERYTYAQVNWIINSLYLHLNPMQGLDIPQLQQFLRDIFHLSSTPSLQQYTQYGFPGIMIATMREIAINPPASGVESVGQALAKFDLAAPVQAQGYGYANLGGVQPLWSATRNMAFMLMVILLVAAGFMVIFRVKINPQTAVTLQLMIPRIIITLALVAFSYAIAGLVIDLVYVVVAAVIYLFRANGTFNGPVADAIRFFTSQDYSVVVVYFLMPWVLIGVIGLIVFLGFSSTTVGFGIGGFLTLIAFLMLLFLIWNLFKIWWMMLKTYITLMFLIVIGPFQIMMGLLPNQGGFNAWFRNIVAQASVFAAVPLMLFLNMFFWTGVPGVSGLLNDLFGVFGQRWRLQPLGDIPSGVGTAGSLPDFPILGGHGTIVRFALGYATLALIPKVADMIRDALKAPKFSYGSAFGEALTPVIPYWNRARGAVVGGFEGVVSSYVGSRAPILSRQRPTAPGQATQQAGQPPEG